MQDYARNLEGPRKACNTEMGSKQDDAIQIALMPLRSLVASLIDIGDLSVDAVNHTSSGW